MSRYTYFKHGKPDTDKTTKRTKQEIRFKEIYGRYPSDRELRQLGGFIKEEHWSIQGDRVKKEKAKNL